MNAGLRKTYEGLVRRGLGNSGLVSDTNASFDHRMAPEETPDLVCWDPHLGVTILMLGQVFWVLHHSLDQAS